MRTCILTFCTGIALACALAYAGERPQWRHLSSAAGDLPQPNGGPQQTACIVADLDGDGLNDIVLAERSQAPALVWLRRGEAGWTRHVLEAAAVPIAAGGAAGDIDRDGDLDLVFGAPAPGTNVWWWENPSPESDKPWARHIIAETGQGMHHDQLFADVTGQPIMVISWFQGGNELMLYRAEGDPRSDTAWESIVVAEGIQKGEGLAIADFDGDGGPDLGGAGRWFEHLGQGAFAAHVIDPAQTQGRMAAGDIVEGGLPEVVMVLGDGVGRLKWYQCQRDPAATDAWHATDLLGEDVQHGHSLAVADMDGDSHLDIFCAEMAQWGKSAENPNARAWLFYGDGQGHFEKTLLSTGVGFHEAKVADLNGDGRLDIVSKPFVWNTPRVDVWLNLGP